MIKNKLQIFFVTATICVFLLNVKSLLGFEPACSQNLQEILVLKQQLA